LSAAVGIGGGKTGASLAVAASAGGAPCIHPGGGGLAAAAEGGAAAGAGVGAAGAAAGAGLAGCCALADVMATARPPANTASTRARERDNMVAMTDLP
jgi:hypothetical protein